MSRHVRSQTADSRCVGEVMETHRSRCPQLASGAHVCQEMLSKIENIPAFMTPTAFIPQLRYEEQEGPGEHRQEMTSLMLCSRLISASIRNFNNKMSIPSQSACLSAVTSPQSPDVIQQRTHVFSSERRMLTEGEKRRRETKESSCHPLMIE